MSSFGIVLRSRTGRLERSEAITLNLFHQILSESFTCRDSRLCLTRRLALMTPCHASSQLVLTEMLGSCPSRNRPQNRCTSQVWYSRLPQSSRGSVLVLN